VTTPDDLEKPAEGELTAWQRVQAQRKAERAAEGLGQDDEEPVHEPHQDSPISDRAEPTA
jgi:hypothetical protein